MKKKIFFVVLLFLLVQIVGAVEDSSNEINSEENQVMSGNMTITGSTVLGEDESLSMRVAYIIGMILLGGALIFIILKIIKKRDNKINEGIID